MICGMLYALLFVIFTLGAISTANPSYVILLMTFALKQWVRGPR